MIWNIEFWKPVVIFNFRDFRIEFNQTKKTVYTRFPDNHWAGGEVDKVDEEKASVLEISPELHLLQMQLAHSIVGIQYLKEPYSVLLWQSAHPDEGKINLTKVSEESWVATALQYYSLGKEGPEARNDVGAFNLLRGAKIDIVQVSNQLSTMLDTARWL